MLIKLIWVTRIVNVTSVGPMQYRFGQRLFTPNPNHYPRIIYSATLADRIRAIGQRHIHDECPERLWTELSPSNQGDPMFVGQYRTLQPDNMQAYPTGSRFTSTPG